MSGDHDKLSEKWNIIKEQLISLCALNVLQKGNDELKTFLTEEIELKNINAQIFNSVCYFVLGIINIEERDKLIQWPLINIKTNAKFRKGVTAMINSFQEKYPWAHIKKLQESYFMNPHSYLPRVLEFLSKLTNLAIHIALDDPETLLPHSGEGLNNKEIKIMTDIISKSRIEEEKLMKQNCLPIQEVEDTKDEVCDKCISLRKENDNLQQQLNCMKKNVKELFDTEDEIDINVLKNKRDEKNLELNTINEELSKYNELSKELLIKIKEFQNPLSLTSKDFGLENSDDLNSATSKVCRDLCQLFQTITLKKSTKEEEHDYYLKLNSLKHNLIEQNKALHSFLQNPSLNALANCKYIINGN